MKSDKEISELKNTLRSLISGYREATSLINDQMQAVIYSDLMLLNELMPRQLNKFEDLQQQENAFRRQLDRLFERYRPEAGRRTLSRLMDSLEEPAGELNRLRDTLSEQVDRSERLREQLMDLLRFAREHNAESFELITSLAAENDGEVYDATGKRKKGPTGSVAINQKA